MGAPKLMALLLGILALVSMTHVIGAAAQYGINTFAPFYQHELGLTRAQVGLFFTAFYIGMAGFSFAAGWLGDSLGVRRTTLIGHVFAGIAVIFASSAQSFGWAFAWFLLTGIGYSFLNPASTKGVLMWFHRRLRATAMGVKQTGVPAGGVLTALLAPLAAVLGWRATLAGVGAVNVLFGLVFCLLWREPDEPSSTDKRPSGGAGRRRLPIRGVLAVSGGTGLLLIGQMSLLTYLPLFLKERLAFSTVHASQWLSIVQGGAVLGRVSWGTVSDRLYRGRRKAVLVLIGVVSVLLCAVLSVLDRGVSPWVLAPLTFLGGFAMIGYQGVSYSLIGEIAGESRAGTALGLMITVNALCTVVGTPLFGYVVDVTGSYAAAWRALAGVLALGTVNLAYFVTEPRRDGAASRPVGGSRQEPSE